MAVQKHNYNIDQQEIIDKIKKDMEKFSSPAFDELIIKAENFLKELNEYLYQNNENLKKIRSHQSGTGKIRQDIKLIAIHARIIMNNNTDATRKLLKMGHDILQAWNEFNQEQVYMAWVDNEGNIFFTDNFEDVYDKISADIRSNVADMSGAGRATKAAKDAIMNANDNTINQIQKFLFSKEISLKDVIETHKGFYKLSQKRYDLGLNKFKHKLFWWNQDNNLQKSEKNLNKGQIGEGYAGLILHQVSDFIKIKYQDNYDYPYSTKNIQIQQEEAIKLIDTASTTKNNTPEIREGDIVVKAETDKNGKVILKHNFLVKAGNKYSTGAIGQYINTAYNILRIQPLWDNINGTLSSSIKITKPLKKYFLELVENHAIDKNLPKIKKGILDSADKEFQEIMKDFYAAIKQKT